MSVLFFVVSSWSPFNTTFWLFFLPGICCFTFLHFGCCHFNTFLSHPLLKCKFLSFGTWFSVVDVLIIFVCFHFVLFFWVFVFYCVWWFAFKLCQLTPFFFLGSYYLWYTTTVSCNIREIFCSLFHCRTLFSWPFSGFFFCLFFCCLFFLRCPLWKLHVFLPSSTPCEITFSFCFFGFIFFAPFLSSDCSSFLEISFLTSPSQIQPPFTFGCLAFLFSIFELLSFHVWCFLLCLFFLLVFVCFCFLSLSLSFFFISGVSLLSFFWFSVGFCSDSVASAVLVSDDVVKEGCFPCGSGVFRGVVQYQFGSRCSATWTWSSGVRKNKELNNGTHFLKGKMRLPFANRT